MNSRNRFGRVDEAAIPTRATNGEKGRNCFINSAPFAWAALTSARGMLSRLESRAIVGSSRSQSGWAST
jgi:hypothetical protein